MKQDGSANFPHIIIANPDKPEANHGFEISEINGFECRNYKRNGFHICRVSAPTQEDAWDMIVPWEKYPTIAHRAVLCHGPSQHFWHADANRYHQNDICPVTKTVHESVQTEIGNDPLRQYVWYLIVLPEGTELENHILSDDAVHVKKGVNEMVESVKLDPDEDEITEVFGCDIYWRIAKKGGNMIRSPDTTGTKKKRYARRKTTQFQDTN
jgi:hypothetical protein